MDVLEQVRRDRENLVSGLEQMQRQLATLSRQVEQQSGALQYCDMLLERVAKEQNGAAPVAEAAPE